MDYRKINPPRKKGNACVTVCVFQCGYGVYAAACVQLCGHSVCLTGRNAKGPPTLETGCILKIHS